jgi:effector-binding domain-containing protein
MRILKYIFLLIVLLAVGISVFIATQKGDYEVTVTRLINTPRNITYNYINDFRNWPQWAGFDGEMKPEFGAITAGKGGSFTWEGDENDGAVKTVRTNENDSIVQQMDWNGLPAELIWDFEESGKKTKVTLRVKGKMGFMPKVRATLKGGTNRIMAAIYEQSLAKLDKTLDFEINTYKINVEGVTEKVGHYYLYQSITSTIENLPMNITIMMGKMQRFFKKNNIPAAGRPFVLYNYYDASKGLTKFAVCIPVREEIFISPGSDVSAGKFAPFRAVKTTLIGDYSHLLEAWDKTFAYIDANNIRDADADYMELYSVGKESGKGPSKWITEIYIPIAAAAVEPVITPVTPAEAPPKPVAPPTDQQSPAELTIP